MTAHRSKIHEIMFSSNLISFIPTTSDLYSPAVTPLDWYRIDSKNHRSEESEQQKAEQREKHLDVHSVPLNSFTSCTDIYIRFHHDCFNKITTSIITLITVNITLLINNIVIILTIHKCISLQCKLVFHLENRPKKVASSLQQCKLLATLYTIHWLHCFDQ